MMKFLVTTVFVAIMGVSSVAAQSVAVGQEGRGYEERGLALVSQLRGDWQTINFAGSEDIARAVCGDISIPTTSSKTLEELDLNAPVVGIAQIDALMTMQLEGCKLLPLAEYPAQEYAFILFPPDSELDSLHDLNKNHRILVDTVGSGTSLFWNTIVRIEKEYGNSSDWINAKSVNGLVSLGPAMASIGEIDAVLLVTSEDSKMVLNWLDNLDWVLGELNDSDINDMEFGRGSLYERETVEFDTEGWWGSASEGRLCCSIFFVANPDWANSNISVINRIVNNVNSLR